MSTRGDTVYVWPKRLPLVDVPGNIEDVVGPEHEGLVAVIPGDTMAPGDAASPFREFSEHLAPLLARARIEHKETVLSG